MSNIAAAVITTFPNTSWNVYAKNMLQSFVANWPYEVPLLVQLDDNMLEDDVKKIIRPQDGCITGWTNEHNEFVLRNKDKDDHGDYRKQAVRFCHKVFALKFASDSAMASREANAVDAPRYLIWMDADVTTTKKVSFDDILNCLPKEGDAVAYMGRKDWDHSECGWLAFDLQSSGDKLINDMYEAYRIDNVMHMEQRHDSWVFDKTLKNYGYKRTNLTEGKPGMEIWPHSPMAKFSIHHKGPVAKQALASERVPNLGVNSGDKQIPLTIHTKNSLPNENIQRHILENQSQIKNWITGCLVNDEEIVVVSAGPTLVAEDLLDEVSAGRKIFAVKHALKPLEQAGITPFGCILLDPRPHVCDFVENPNKEIHWIVASQVDPAAVKTLLDAGCTVWGYHAAVGAEEARLIEKQPHSIVHGGSATATRGLFLLEKMGFRNFRLYGYDLCFTDKPNLNEKDDIGQQKYFEVSISAEKEHYKGKKSFWSDGQLLAQYQEFVDILNKTKWKIRAFGNGIVPFLTEADRVSNLRQRMKKNKLGDLKPIHYEDLLGCKRKNSLTNWRSMLPKTLRKRSEASS